jgi:hypothetical protein
MVQLIAQLSMAVAAQHVQCILAAQKSNYHPLNCLHMIDVCKSLHFRDTFETLMVNSSLSNIQKTDVSILKGEANNLTANLAIT